MRELRIVLTKSRKKFPIGSWTIRGYTGKDYSHCARGFTVYGDIDMYYQASEGRVNYENEKVFLQKHEIVREYTLMIPEEQYKAISRACLEDAGVVYGFKQNLGIFLVDIAYWATGKKFDNPWKRGRNCSELLYINVFSVLCPECDYDPDLIKPHNIEEIILDHFKEVDGKWVLI